VYTVPAIHDHSTNTTLSDSERILKYLDDAYPDTPQLTTSSHMDEELVKQAFDSMWPLPLSALMLNGLWGLMVPVIIKHIDEASALKYRSRFEVKTGVTVESLLEEDKRLELKTKARASLKEADRQLEEIGNLCGGKGPWLLGKEAKLPDLAVGGTLAYVAAVLGEDSELWREIRQWDAGRWGNRWDEIKPYHKLY
jgi:glutathione S-transferase